MGRRLLYLFAILLCAARPLRGSEIFRATPSGRPANSHIFTITPSRVRAGSVVDLLITGQNLLPRNDWKTTGLRVLRERWIDSNTTIVTVHASPDLGVKQIAANDSQSLTIEALGSGNILHDDFDDGNLSGWDTEAGSWMPDTGEAEGLPGKKGRLMSELEATDNVTIDFDMTFDSGKRAGFYFQYRDADNYRLFYLDSKKSKMFLVDHFNGKDVLSRTAPLTNPFGVAHHYTITVTNNLVDVTVDGTTSVFNVDFGTIYSGSLGFYSKQSTVHFDNIDVFRDPSANAIPLPDFTSSAAGPDATFDASDSLDPDGTLVSYSWEFGDNTTGTGITPSHTYHAAGTYAVVLKVTDNSGATTSIAKNITISLPNDKDMIKQVVLHFFQLYDDVEHLTGEQICVDFSHDPACPARQKQIDDINQGKQVLVFNQVFYLSDVLVTLQSSTKAYPVKIHNLFKYQIKGDPVMHTTDGWHIYHMQKEADGKWHQCSYTFQLVSES